jgi:hypothetical protein
MLPFKEYVNIRSSPTFTFLHFLAAIDLDFLLSDSRGIVYVQVHLKEYNVSLMVEEQIIFLKVSLISHKFPLISLLH